MSFTTWIKQQAYRHDEIGDLARDAYHLAAQGIYPASATRTDWRIHLRSQGACDEAMAALEQAWKEYRTTATHHRAQQMSA